MLAFQSDDEGSEGSVDLGRGVPDKVPKVKNLKQGSNYRNRDGLGLSV